MTNTKVKNENVGLIFGHLLTGANGEGEMIASLKCLPASFPTKTVYVPSAIILI